MTLDTPMPLSCALLSRAHSGTSLPRRNPVGLAWSLISNPTSPTPGIWPLCAIPRLRGLLRSPSARRGWLWVVQGWPSALGHPATCLQGQRGAAGAAPRPLVHVDRAPRARTRRTRRAPPTRISALDPPLERPLARKLCVHGAPDPVGCPRHTCAVCSGRRLREARRVDADGGPS